MASVRRTTSPARPRAVRAAAVLLLAVAALSAGPAARPAVAAAPGAVPASVPAAAAAPAVPVTAPLARSGDGSGDGGDAVRNGMLLSLGSVLLLTGAACAVLYRRRPPSDR
ncbi:hypothetical protein ABZ747_10230 [Kitasatospora cineracea]|uniref:hypothetical protein n=1 Tax=Kitasatospora cineracea TaxID=88074 RepID=UPI0033CE0CAE